MVLFGNSGIRQEQRTMKDYTSLITYLKKNSVDATEAIEIYKRAIKINPENYRTRWKMTRFAMYLHARIEEHKKGQLDRKINTIRKIVTSLQYKKEYKNFPFGSFDIKREINKLNKLISYPRQYPIFKSHNFRYKGTEKNIPQETIDKIR